MVLAGLLSCIRAMSFRMFPFFPQLQVALPSIQRVPLAITNGNENQRETDLAKWLQESFLQFAAPKKRVRMEWIINRIGFNYKEKTT